MNRRCKHSLRFRTGRSAPGKDTLTHTAPSSLRVPPVAFAVGVLDRSDANSSGRPVQHRLAETAPPTSPTATLPTSSLLQRPCTHVLKARLADTAPPSYSVIPHQDTPAIETPSHTFRTTQGHSGEPVIEVPVGAECARKGQQRAHTAPTSLRVPPVAFAVGVLDRSDANSSGRPVQHRPAETAPPTSPTATLPTSFLIAASAHFRHRGPSGVRLWSPWRKLHPPDLPPLSRRPILLFPTV